jgi:hypothetical protein
VFKIKQVTMKRDDEGPGWQTVIDVESQFGVIEPQLITIVMPKDESAPAFGEAWASARGYVRKLFTERGAEIE